jgi:hypothetical protein
MIKNRVKKLVTKISIIGTVVIISIFLHANLYAEKMTEHETIDQTHPRARLIVGSKGLHKKIHIIKAKVAPFRNWMRGQATIQNLTDKTLTLECKFDWLDDEGFLIGDGGIWQRFPIGPRDLRPFKSLGKSKYASKMQFTVRFPGDSLIYNSSNK